MQSKGQAYRAFVLQGRAPMIGVGVSKKNLPNYKGPADLKGKKIGVTAPGSSTNMVVSFFLAKHGLKASDVSIIGVGAGAGAVTALRSGQIDAISNTDPVVSMLEMPGDIQIIVDTRTLKDTQDIFGGNMPAGADQCAGPRRQVDPEGRPRRDRQDRAGNLSAGRSGRLQGRHRQEPGRPVA
ncbi:hypothetical protein G6F24_015160 [Rhizopus arrhizus]|nr:hypothetical protein G6F24_015160 [Rhizopus arrhizus]